MKCFELAKPIGLYNSDHSDIFGTGTGPSLERSLPGSLEIEYDVCHATGPRPRCYIA